jgi:hypothetical protein
MKIIKQVNPNDVEVLVKEAYNHKLTLKGNYELYALYVEDEAVSIGAIQYKEDSAMLKFAYTPIRFQGNGYHTRLLKYRVGLCKCKGIKKIDVYCMKPSLNNHLKAGAIIKKEFKHGGALVTYESL